MESIKKEERNHESWLANYQGNSLRQYRRAWEYWSKYMGDKTEDWITENKLTEDWASHLVNFHRWLKQQPKARGIGTLSDNTAKVLTNGIRGYFKHIGIAIGLTTVQANEITTVESEPTKDYPFNLRIKEQLLRVADPIEEYIISAGVSFGLRIGDFQEITRGMLEPLLNEEIPVQLPSIRTKKEGILAYPFIDRDAKDAIERLLKTNPENKMLTLTQRQINDTLKKLFEKAGIDTGDYRVRFHILRKFLTDKLSSVCSQDKWKNFVGKATRSPYVTEEGREAYKKVMEFTCVNGAKIRGITEETVSTLKERIKDLENVIDLLVKLNSDPNAVYEAGCLSYDNLMQAIKKMKEKQNV